MYIYIYMFKIYAYNKCVKYKDYIYILELKNASI